MTWCCWHQPSERHFDPFSATAAFALVLVVRYLHGLTGSLGKGAEAAGEATGERIDEVPEGTVRPLGRHPG